MHYEVANWKTTAHCLVFVRCLLFPLKHKGRKKQWERNPKEQSPLEIWNLTENFSLVVEKWWSLLPLLLHLEVRYFSTILKSRSRFHLYYTFFLSFVFFCLCVCLFWCGAEGFYAVNNPFLVSGPKGFTEFKMLENEDMFIRIDFPGVPQDSIKVRIDPTKKAVSITADAPKEHKHDSSPRNYGSATGLVCKCCEISGLVSHMSDGVLRLHLSKTRASSQSPSCICILLSNYNPFFWLFKSIY